MVRPEKSLQIPIDFAKNPDIISPRRQTMRPMNLYDCKIGDVVLTGDSYGMSCCVCIEERTYKEDYGFDMVVFLDLTTGNSHESGGTGQFPLDYCYLCDRISKEQVERVKQVWGV